MGKCQQCGKDMTIIDGAYFGILCGRCWNKSEHEYSLDRYQWKQNENKQPCMFDNFRYEDGPLGLACSCPKCSPR